MRCVSKKFNFVKMSTGQSDIYETSTHSGEDAWFIGNNIIGVADGVSGWATKGVSAAFSHSLMMESEKYSKSYPLLEPIEILDIAYTATKNNVIGGSSTACIAKLNGPLLSVCNHGDSGIIVIRDRKIIFQTYADYIKTECPFQLGKWELVEDPGDEEKVNIMYNQVGRRIVDTKIYQCEVQDHDIIIMGTDGFFDNITQNDIIASLGPANNPNDISLDLIKKSIKNTLEMNPSDIDDITIIVSIVTSMNQ
jgi:protein phosphatase PTC7